MEDAEQMVNFEQCPLERVCVYRNNYAEIRRRATVKLSLGQLTAASCSRPGSPPPGLLPKQPHSDTNGVLGPYGRSASPAPSVRRSLAGVTTRRHSVALRGLPGACLAAESLRVELLDYKAPTPISLDDVQLVYPKRAALGKVEPAESVMLEQKSLRDQLTHIRRRYESALARKHRLLAQRTILDRVADTMSRGTSPLRGPDIYGTSSTLYADPQQMTASQQNHQPMGSDSYRPLSMPNMNPSVPESFVPSAGFIDALQGFLQLYDDRTHKVDDSLADTNVELEHLEEQLNHLSSLCSEADMRAPSPHLLMLTLSHFVLHNNSPDEPAALGRVSPAMVEPAASNTAVITLSISYTVHGAFWTPTYELRLRPDDSAVQLVYSVAVTQTTGEDWVFEREGDDDTTCTRLCISTSHASVSPAAPTAPSPDKIYVRRSTSSIARKIDHKRSRNSQRPPSGAAKHRRSQSQQLGVSTPNLLAPGGDARQQGFSSETEDVGPLMAPRSRSPVGGAPGQRPYSINQLYQSNHHMYNVIYNETSNPDSLGSYYSTLPIQHASSFATFVTPGQSVTNMATTGDYDNDWTYAAPSAAPGGDQQGVDADLIPSGMFFEADVSSAAVTTSANQPWKPAHYVLSSGASVPVPPSRDSADERVVVVRVPTARQSANTPIKFVVGCHDLEVIKLSYEATPRLAASAFARAHLRNTSPLPLLAGSVAVFHDRASGSALFAYRTHLPYVAVGDDFLVALGPDPAVAIDYQPPQRRSMFGGGLSSVPMAENLDGGGHSLSRVRGGSFRSRSHDVNARADLMNEDAENKKSAAMTRWSYYRQLIGISNRHQRAVVRIHVVEPLPKPADKNLRLVLEAPVIQEVDMQVDENGKKVRSSRKAKLKAVKAESLAAKLNSSHQLEWDLRLQGGETKYLEIRYRLQLKAGALTKEVRRQYKNTDIMKTPLLYESQPAKSQPPPSQYGSGRPLATLTLPRSSSANVSRPSSPFRSHSPTNCQPGTQPAAGTHPRPAPPRPISSYQIHPVVGTSQLPYRSAMPPKNPQDDQQQQRFSGIRYTVI